MDNIRDAYEYQMAKYAYRMSEYLAAMQELEPVAPPLSRSHAGCPGDSPGPDIVSFSQETSLLMAFGEQETP